MKILWLGSGNTYSGRRVREAARECGLNLECREVLDIDFMVENGRAQVSSEGEELLDSYDVLVVRTFFPYISEALTIARFFRAAGKTVINQSLTDKGYAVSKMHDYLILSNHGIMVPRTYQTYDSSKAEAIAERLGYPCVLKGIHGARGQNVYLVGNAEQLRHTLWRYVAGDLLLQEFVQATEDYRVVVIGYRSLPLFVSRNPAPGDFRTNFAVGGQFAAHALRIPRH